jgi:2Fe-2S ferredoxin
MEEIHIKVIDRNDQEHQIEIPLGIDLNMMEVCKAENLPVEGTCGGMALCSTCHIYVLSDNQLPDISEEEEDMLDQAFFVEENSRLGCQLKINKNLEGLVVKLAPAAE